MLFAKLLLSPLPHARIRRIDASAALAMPGVVADHHRRGRSEAAAAACSSARHAAQRANTLPEVALATEPFYQGEPIVAVAAIDEADGNRGDRENQGRVRAAAVCRRSDGDAAAWRTESRAPKATSGVRRKCRRFKISASRRSPSSTQAACRCSRTRPSAWEIGDVDEGFKNADYDSRRDDRAPVHRPSGDGAALGDGVLAERQALSCTARRSRSRGRVANVAQWVGLSREEIRSSSSASTPAADSAARFRARRRWRFRRFCRRRPAVP